jgi:hypothetical protein
MSIALESTTHADYVCVACAGIYTTEEWRPLLRRFFEHAAIARRDAVLVDVRKLTGREPTMAERYDQAVHIAELQNTQNPRIRIAFLGHEPMIHPERFGEIIATNRGAVARAFTDEALALEWLLGRQT